MEQCLQGPDLLLTSEWELVTSRNTLDDNVLGSDTLFLQFLDTSFNKSGDHDVVPSSVDDSDSL